ncbi:MAG: hypothetical protein QOH18_1197 [Solirubrobacterales bacterium]|nr:hypothetical protein [Solirubrobacterales bacterium]
MRLRQFRRTVLAAIVFAALALPAVDAHADGPRTPIVVARGHSLFGAPWQIRFGEELRHGGEPDYATFLFTVGNGAEREECGGCGFYSSIPLPLPRKFTFDGSFGSDFDRFPEADISGTSGPLVSRLALTMTDGSVFEAELLRAPERVLARHPRLSRFRFFDLFFPDTAEPASISAYGRQGQLLENRSG